MRRIGAVLAIFLAAGASAGAVAWAAPSASPVKGTWGAMAEVPGLPALSGEGVEVVTSASCTGPGDCAVGGAYQSTDDTGPSPDQAYVVSESGGTWGSAEAVPGTVALNTGVGATTTAVSCSSPGNCAAAGYYAYQYGKSATGVAGFVANQVNGTWQQARPVPALAGSGRLAQVTTVSCAPAPTAAARTAGLNCVAGGVSQLSSGATAGFVLAEAHGTWGTARTVPGLPATPPGSGVTSVSCWSPGNCGLGGYYADKYRHAQAFVANEVNGTWHDAQQVPGTATLNAGGNARVTSVSCPAAGACAAAGTYQPKSGPGQVFVVTEGGGQWKRAIQLPGSARLITGNGSAVGAVSCASAASCEAGGTLTTGKSGSRGFLAGEAGGQWGTLSVVPGGTDSAITALSCPAPGYCAAGGQEVYTSSGSIEASPITVSEVAGRWGAAVALATGFIGASDTESVYAISCAAPASCAAGGNLGGGKGRPYAAVATEVPAA
jgi:hypothetical protein